VQHAARLQRAQVISLWSIGDAPGLTISSIMNLERKVGLRGLRPHLSQ
jgi:hypothetical protein